MIGYGCVREVAGGYIKRILIGPLYADNLCVANSLVHALLNKYSVSI